MRVPRISSLVLLSFACSDKDSSDPPPNDTGTVGVTIETGLWIDTSSPIDTGSPDTGNDTGDDTGGDTGEIDPETPEYDTLSLYPDGLVVHPGAQFTMRLVGLVDGLPEDVALEHIEFESMDEGLATIDSAGSITAVAAGNVTIHARVGEMETSAELVIDDSGLLRLRIIHAETGLPIASAKVKVEEGEAVRTDTDGWATVEVDTGEPLSVHAYLSGYMPVTLFRTVGREITVPLQDAALFATHGTELAGSIGFDGVDSGGGADMIVGLALPALPHGPLLLDPDALMSEDRDLSIFGIDVSLPGNIYLGTHAESFAVPAMPEQAAAWTVAGPMPISEVTSSLDGAGDAFALIDAHIDTMSWGWSGSTTVSLDETASVDLAPSTALSRSARITTAELPLGFSGDEVALVMVGETVEEVGAVALGLATGLGEIELPVADTSLGGEPLAMAIAQVGGLGSGGAVSAVLAPWEDELTQLPEFQTVPEMMSFDAVTHEFELNTDERADIVRVLMTGADRSMRMIYMDGGSQSGHLADYGGSMGYGSVTWEVLGFETLTGTFEGFVHEGQLSAATLAPRANTSARVTRTIVASSR